MAEGSPVLDFGSDQAPLAASDSAERPRPGKRRRTEPAAGAG